VPEYVEVPLRGVFQRMKNLAGYQIVFFSPSLIDPVNIFTAQPEQEAQDVRPQDRVQVDHVIEMFKSQKLISQPDQSPDSRILLPKIHGKYLEAVHIPEK
jgi:hypothetical protein